MDIDRYRQNVSRGRMIFWFVAFVSTAAAGFWSISSGWSGAAFLAGLLFGLSAHHLGQAHRTELLRRKYG
jgi:hypothetical protein